jgi:hypothetical protein
MDTNTTTANPILDSLSTEDIAAALAARGLAIAPVKAPKVKVEKVEKTPEELLIEAVGQIVTVGEDGKLAVIPAADRTEDAKAIFEALSLKSRTTLEKIADAKKPPVSGAKRGPKSKAEKEAAAAALAAAASNPDGSAPAASGDETPAA